MAEAIQVYLHDHYSGSTFAVELLETLTKEYPKDEIAQLSKEILAEVNQDRDVLQNIIHRIGSMGPDLKDVGAWVAEKISRLKLQDPHPDGLGAFEALEALSLGILGKKSLWEALKTTSAVDPRIEGFDWEALKARADSQYSRVEGLRLRTASRTFARTTENVR